MNDFEHRKDEEEQQANIVRMFRRREPDINNQYRYGDKENKTLYKHWLRELNRELSLRPRLSTKDDGTHNAPKRLKQTLEDFLNSYHFLEHEGEVIDSSSIYKFIKRIQKEIEEDKEETNEEEDEEEESKDEAVSSPFAEQNEQQSCDLLTVSDNEGRKRQQQIEANIKTARDALDKAIQLMKDEKVLLRPLPPRTNKQPQRYADIRFNHENAELIEYLKKFGHGFKSKNESYLVVNEPNDYIKAVEALLHYKKYDNEYITDREDEDNKEPIKIYYFNHLTSLDDVFKGLQTVFDNEIKPFKIFFQFTGIFETPKADGDNEYDYEAREINWTHYKGETPMIVRLPEDLNKVKMYIETKLYEHETPSTSNTKLTIINSISFTVSRLIRITGRIDKVSKLFGRNKFVVTDNVDDKLCWYRFLAICLNTKLSDVRTFKTSDRTLAAKRLLLKKHGIEYTNHMTNQQKEQANKIINEFKGVNMYEMKEEAKEYELNINIYDYIEKQNHFNLTEHWKNNDSNIFHSAVLFVNDSIIHIMYIKPKGVESLTNLLICPICMNHVETKNHKDRMAKHIKKCKANDGSFTKEFRPNREALPYIPHILSNPVYEYCLAHGLEWKPSIHYITYDFETMEQKVNKSISDSTTINSRLIPLSVSSCVKLDSGLITKHFDIRTKSFIAKWIEWLFEKAVEVYKDKLKHLMSFIKDKTEDELNDIDKRMKTITVFGFNSSRFDSNLFKEYFNHSHWLCEGLIGSASSLKQFVLKSSKYDVKLRFIDAQSFVAGGTLKQFGIDFGGIDNSVKGVFPYEAINDENYNDVLSKSEPFSYDDFYSYLNQRNPLTKSDYEEYVNDSKRFQTRWDYLLHYNDNDVEMMIKPLDNLIQMNAEYKVDLINNLSLSKNSSCIKYALAYKDFDVDTKYGIINDKTTFKPDIKWWSYKCQSYKRQDEKYNQTTKGAQRNITKCVSEKDFEEFLKRYEHEGFCYLCREHFTPSNRPTLDRINNDIGHELSNCKFACAECNVLRNRKDVEITKLRIQLKKFCKLHHLPTLITDEKEYHSLRENITGGISNVLHRMNIKGLTKINRFTYDAIDNRVISQDTFCKAKDGKTVSNTVSHIMGIDFNSLYPSSFSSMKHDFNRYHGGVMYMPGSFIRRFDVYDENGVKNEKLYQMVLNKFINNGLRFKKDIKREDVMLFKAEVKLRCPKNKINYFINLPPVFRKLEITNDEQTIGSYMYNYIKANKLNSLNESEKHLTNLIDTCGHWMTFSNYYLWWLLDHGLEIIDIKSLSLYESHDGFKPFVGEFMKKRQDILSGKVKGNEKFYKLCLNGSYGFDGINTEHYNKVKIVDIDKAFRAIISDTYINGYKIGDDNYLIQSQPRTFKCTTCLQESFFTLDLAKYWFLVFYYDFLCKALDMNRIHVNTIETDSYYFSIAGDINEGIEQGFKHVIKDERFYNENIYKFMPNPMINDVYDSKKILGCCVEKVGECQIALCPKCYTLYNLDGLTKSLKLKGVSLKKNNIKASDYREVIDEGIIKHGKNINLQLNQHLMSKITVNKNSLTGKHVKMVVLPNQSCAPYIEGLSAKDYFVEMN